MSQRTEAIEVEGGAIPTVVVGEPSEDKPSVLVVPSIFGPAPDLIQRLSRFAEKALIAVPDPFWRVGGGVLPYDGMQQAIARMQRFDLKACNADLDAASRWLETRSNGRTVGVGICFGGPFVLRLAAKGRLAGGITWHGSRMENALKFAPDITCPLRMHFGEQDPITPPEAIEQIREGFANHPDLAIFVHPGAVHGFSHDGDAYDEEACEASFSSLGALIDSLS